MEGLLIAEQLRRVTPLLPSTPPELAISRPLHLRVAAENRGAVALQPPTARPSFHTETRCRLSEKTHTGFQDLLVARAGGDLLSAEQVKLDRALKLTFAPFRGFVETPGVVLVAELTGRNCNLILLDEGGTILGAAREVTSSINRFREVRAGLALRTAAPL